LIASGLGIVPGPFDLSAGMVGMTNRITLPQNTLVVLVGPAGSGKSFFAAKHFLSTQVVSSDECRAQLSDDSSNQSISGHAFALMHFIVDKRLFLGRLTVADATNLTRDARTPLIKSADKAGFHTAAIIFQTSLETCLARNSTRMRVVPEDALREQYALFEIATRGIDAEQFDFVFTVNTADEEELVLEITPESNRLPVQPSR
jgi:protein phosphatase